MGGNGMAMVPAAHPQLMKILNHIVYVGSGGGNHSMWVWIQKSSIGGNQYFVYLWQSGMLLLYI